MRKVKLWLAVAAYILVSIPVAPVIILAGAGDLANRIGEDVANKYYQLVRPIRTGLKNWVHK